MIQFCQLYFRLDATTRTNEKLAALVEYFRNSEPADSMWAVNFLIGRRVKRLVGVRQLAQWAIEIANLPEWLFDECYDRVGDLAETISLILPANDQSFDIRLSELVQNQLLPLQDLDESEKRERILELWSRLDQRQLFVVGKLLTGGFRVGVSKKLVIRALAEYAELEPAIIAHRLMGQWQPTESFFRQLIGPDDGQTVVSQPYPFFLANPIKTSPHELGQFEEFLVEWKWDGIRAQLIRREGAVFIWSRGDELVTEQFPEIEADAKKLPDGIVIDGELLAWDRERNLPMEFSQLQRRLGRKKVGKKLLQEVPIAMLSFDLIEAEGADIRSRSLTERQKTLAEVLGRAAPELIRLPPKVAANNWDEAGHCRETSKKMLAEGLMLKRKDSGYQVGRPVGDWWKWKVDPYTVDAVLIYAQRGHGRRASLYSDYTFGLWDGDRLVPFAKAYSGLTDAEIREVDAFVRRNTKEKFGPVRSVAHALVFELAFENIQRSKRHKSGIAVRFPRINRWRRDKCPADADHLSTIIQLISD